MKYHEPDERWAIFGMNSFEDYCEKSVAEGLFCSYVPEEIREAYKNAEYIMAHAYYHYPLYEEAFSKLLMTIEMAVKQRCIQFDIPLQTTNKYDQLTYKTFDNLIQEMSRFEATKKIENGLHWLRKKRNQKLHEYRHTVSGSMFYNFMKVGVTMLNKIFIPKEIFESSEIERSSKQQLLNSINHKPLVFENKNYLVEKLEVKDALIINGKSVYLVTIHPVTHDIQRQIERADYKQPEMFTVESIEVNGSQILMSISDSKEEITFRQTSHPKDIETYNKFISDREEVLNRLNPITIDWFEFPVGMHNEFLYESLHKL
jgi:hypothetical protein